VFYAPTIYKANKLNAFLLLAVFGVQQRKFFVAICHDQVHVPLTSLIDKDLPTTFLLSAWSSLCHDIHLHFTPNTLNILVLWIPACSDVLSAKNSAPTFFQITFLSFVIIPHIHLIILVLICRPHWADGATPPNVQRGPRAFSSAPPSLSNYILVCILWGITCLAY